MLFLWYDIASHHPLLPLSVTLGLICLKLHCSNKTADDRRSPGRARGSDVLR